MGIFDKFFKKNPAEAKKAKTHKRNDNSFVFKVESASPFHDNEPKESEYLETKKLPEDIEIFTPAINVGLTSQQVEQRINEGLSNHSKAEASKSIGQILFENIVTYFNMLLLAIAILLIVFGQYTQLSFMIIVIANTIIGIVQSIKAKKTIDKLKVVTSSRFEVIRDGKKDTVSTEDLVLNDIYYVKIGDQIPTDSILKDGKIEVNESLLTGEPLPIQKTIGSKIFAGSIVVSGSATLLSESIGDFNYIAGVQAKAKVLSKPKSELVRALNNIIKVIGIIIIPLGGLTFWTQWLAFYSPDRTLFDVASDVIKAMAGSMVGMIPTGMYLLTSLALATSVISLSKSNALVQDLYSVEMLARVNVLCLDKTGTLTDGSMLVQDVNVLDKTLDIPKIIGSYLNAFEEENQTTIALKEHFGKNQDYKVVQTISFSSARKYSAVQFEQEGTFILGAPEYLYKGNDQNIIDYVSQKQSLGYRVVIICKGNDPISQGEINGIFKPVALIALEDHIRDNAPETIQWFINNGVQIKVISGDNPQTVSEIAKKCHIPNAERFISLEGLSNQQVLAAVSEFTVFGRVSPEQKALIVQELKNEGKTVGMTGDGVNDILAMKRADCSVAMANGSSAARNCANLVLLDSNFTSMPKAVKEGRRAINNVQRSSALYLMKTIFTLAFTIIVLLTYFNAGHGIKYPFSPNNLLILEMVCIGLISIFLAIQKNDAQITGHFIHNTFARAIPAGICMIIVVGINYIIKASCDFLGNDDLAFTTLNSFSVTAIGIGMAYNCCEPIFPLSNSQNRYRAILFFVSLICVCIGVFGFGNIPSITLRDGVRSNMCWQLAGVDYHTLSWQMWMLLGIYVSVGTIALHFLVKWSEIRSQKQLQRQLEEQESNRDE